MMPARFAALLVVALVAALGLAPTAAAAPCAGYGFAAAGDTVTRFSTATNAAAGSVAVTGGRVPASLSDIAISPDGERAYVVDTPNDRVVVIDTTTNTQVATITVGTSPQAIVFSADGSKAYVAASDGIWVITTATYAAALYASLPGPARDVAVGGNGTVYATVPTTSVVYAITDATVSTPASLTIGTAPTALALAPDGSTLYVASTGDRSIYSTPTSSFAPATRFAVLNDTPQTIAVSPDGATLYAGTTASGLASLIAISTATQQQTPIGSAPTGSAGTTAIGLKPDGTAIYAGNSTGITVLTNGGTIATPLSGLTSTALLSIALCRAVVPGAPTGTVATAGDTIAAITWTAPTDTGGAQITSYTATAMPGGAFCTTTGATTCTVSGLRNTVAHTFRVAATTIAGTGAASAASVAVTPHRDNSARQLVVGKPKVTFSKRGISIAFNVTATAAGTIAATMTIKNDRYCSKARRVATAGTYRMTCVLKMARRVLARSRSMSYLLKATFSPRNGPVASAQQSVVIPRRR